MAPLLSLSLSLLTLLLASPAHALWPLPRTLQTGPSTAALRLSPSFHISLSLPHNATAPQDLIDAAARATGYLTTDALGRLVVGRGTSDAAAVARAPQLTQLTLELTRTGNATGATQSITQGAQAPLGARDEAYTLTVPADGAPAVVRANSTLGLFRGLTTFGQMWYAVPGAGKDAATYALGVPVWIEDSPAYPYRGLTLDTARNYFPVADIKRTLDAMSWVKINTFHWHVVDSQSFPLQIPGFEDLAATGAYSAEQVYSPADVADIVAYAGARGIDVLAEIDTPGHTSVISKAHPEHIACAEATPWTTYANEPPAGQLRLTNATATYTASLLRAAAALFPSSLFSTGGDEINARCYADDAQTQAALVAGGQTVEQALSAFVGVTGDAVRAAGKRVVAWEEMVLDHNVTLANDTVIMVWISSLNAAKVAQKGFDLVHAASDYFYLDCGGGGWVGAYPEGNSWCDPFKTWQKAYSFDPLANLTTPTERARVLGGQHLLWTEQSGPANLDPVVWPRAAASAEVFWSGAAATANVSAALPRLHDVAYRFERRGVRAIRLQPEWCALRPGACDLTA